MSSSTQLPATLLEWKTCLPARPRDIWNPLEEYFKSQGLTLWVPSGDPSTYPADRKRRAPDGFVHVIPANLNRAPFFDQTRNIHCAATTDDGRHVVIRLIKKGDQGETHLQVLRRIASGGVGLLGDNHALPVLREIVHDDMVFVLFPLMSGSFFIRYERVEDAFKAMTDVLEGIEFCHRHLVAHLDIDGDNILLNYVGAGFPKATDDGPGWRSQFPIRHYLNDFEFAAIFDPDSSPESRLWHLTPQTITEGKYVRDPPPEWRVDEPFCPFKVDIWQLGHMFNDFFGTLEHMSIDLKRLFDKMESIDPQNRPTCLDVLQEVRRIKSDLPPNVLSGPLPNVAPTVEPQIIEPTTGPQTKPLMPSSQDVAGEVVTNVIQ